METRREIRVWQGAGAPRVREAGEAGGGRTIEGYAVVFGVESVLLVDWCEAYREIIEPGAVTEADLAGFDIKMLLWHNRERLLARWTRGEGTLRLSVDDHGVRYSFDAPHTPDGEIALELVRRGDLNGSSFAYWADENSGVRYEKAADGTLVRHVMRIGQMFDTSIVSDPAYQQTSVTAREIPLLTPGVPELQAKKAREAEEAEVLRRRIWRVRR